MGAIVACRMAGWSAVLGSAWAAGSLAGCATNIPAECERGVGARAYFGEYNNVPRPRMGTLPFPGVFTLYTTAGEDLGSHSYGVSGLLSEVERGLVYTCDGGFMDVSHIRNAADMTAYLHARVLHAMRNGWTCLRYRGKEPSVYRVELRYPAGWAGMDPDTRLAVIDEASVRVAQRLAIKVMTWHEILSWYGYKSSGFISERGSAFTYDDGPSHALGVLIAGEVLRSGDDFDAGVTDLLDAALLGMGRVSTSELHEAALAVEGAWWANGRTLVRHFETGLEAGDGAGRVTPWLAPGLDFCEGARPRVFEIPGLDDVLGHDLSGLYRVEIEPRVFESGKILAVLPDADGRVDARRDFPLLIADIREAVGEEFTRVDQPDWESIGSR